jgi:hypothetical protein
VKKFLIVVVAVCLIMGGACAEDNVWALCKSYVNLRESPSKKAQVVGYLDSGDGAETDGVIRDGWLHIISPTTESGDSWVNLAYMVDTQPERIDGYAHVVSNGRVAIRTTVNGKRRAWANPGDKVEVLLISGEWALTNRGYIKSEYLEVE